MNPQVYFSRGKTHILYVGKMLLIRSGSNEHRVIRKRNGRRKGRRSQRWMAVRKQRDATMSHACTYIGKGTPICVSGESIMALNNSINSRDLFTYLHEYFENAKHFQGVCVNSSLIVISLPKSFDPMNRSALLRMSLFFIHRVRSYSLSSSNSGPNEKST